MVDSGANELVEDLFRRESAHLIAALVRLLGPSQLALAEDVVHDALLSAMHAWRLGLPNDPKAWLLQTAKNRAIDRIRRDRRLLALAPELSTEQTLAHTLAAALSADEDGANQLAMMFSICDERLSQATHVTLLLRLLSGLSPPEIARAFLVDTQTVDRRLHRGRSRLEQVGRLHDVNSVAGVRARQPSVLAALYLLFNEGYHGNNPQNPLQPAMCAEAIRLAELMLDSRTTAHVEVHALLALFYLNAARLGTRLDEEGVFVPLADQDRARWDRSLIERGLSHLAEASTGDRLTTWHLEAGIACEHTLAPSIQATNWRQVVELYDQLLRLMPSPVVALNRGLAVAELRGLDAGRQALSLLADDEKLAHYHFFWAARGEIERRAGRAAEARAYYERAQSLARNRAEQLAYQRKLEQLEN